MSDIKLVSYSQYSMYRNCPAQWKLRYVDKHRLGDDSIESIFGTAIHKTSQDWISEFFKDEKTAKLVDLAPAFKNHLIEEFQNNVKLLEDGTKKFICNRGTLEEYYLDGCLILEHFKKDVKKFFPTENCKLIGCEVPMELELFPDVNFIGYIDIVIYDEKSNIYHIFDLKTSKAGWTYHKKDKKKTDQVLLYKSFYSKKFGVPLDSIHPRFIILKRKLPTFSPYPVSRISEFEPSHGSPSISKFEKSWDEFLEKCFNSDGSYRTDLAPTPSAESCRFCVYKNRKDLCPDGFYK